MSKKKYNLGEFVERRLVDAGIEIELPDGQIVLPPPELWPDAVNELFKADDYEGAARLILGEDAHCRFVAAGGTWKLLNAILVDARGADAGE